MKRRASSLFLATACGRSRQDLHRARGFATSTQPENEAEVMVSKLGKYGRMVQLNRPKALNALNLTMVEVLTPLYQGWKLDASAKFVVMKGVGGKSFCAGGDIREIYDEGVAARAAGKAEDVPVTSLRHRFFKEEYILDYLIASMGKPHIALLNGITMGGGVGLSVHGQYRVATEHTVFAMPETAIGFFCDVGGSHFLPRVAPGFEIGLYLALTGARLKGYDVVRAGVATHYVPLASLPEVEKRLSDIDDANHIPEVLDQFSSKSADHQHDKSELLTHMNQIKKCFAEERKSVEDIITALQHDGSQWALDTHKALSKLSPTSLKVVFRQLHEGKKRNLAKCFEMEFRMSQAFMVGHDFYEGVRSVLVDKDRNPKWKPSKLEEISDEEVDRYFRPLSDPAKELRLE